MNFDTQVYLMSSFMAVIAVILLWLSYRERGSTEEESSIVKFSFALFLFGLLYLSLAHIGAVVGLSMSYQYSNLAPCENVVQNSTYNGTTSFYTYVDSCSTRTVPGSFSNFYVMTMVILSFDLFMLFVGVTVFMVKVVRRWW